MILPPKKWSHFNLSEDNGRTFLNCVICKKNLVLRKQNKKNILNNSGKINKINEKLINLAYDAAGRLVKENNKVYQYSGLDKVTSISEGGKVIASYNYSISGQLASATTDGATENFLWDGLALIRRGDTDYTNEPYATCGNPVVAGDKVLFNDVLGNTVDIKSEDKLKVIKMTAFGETADKDAFFTGKPAVDNLGYSFLFRNYRADQGKWQTSDPTSYPDGWNNLAYVDNRITEMIDYKGLCSYQFVGSIYVWVPCSQANPYASANMTVKSSSTNIYTAVCGTHVSGTKSFTFSLGVTIAEALQISASISESVEIGSQILDAAPHDASGSGFITIGAVYSITYYELGYIYNCGKKTDITYHIVSTNCASKVLAKKSCVHE